jgi:phosphoglycerate dehydrogenase-like enzyme
MAPAIHVGPEPLERLVQAVKDGGGEVVDSLDGAEAVVWAGSETELAALPASGKWVQLQSAGIEPWVQRIRDTPDVQFTSAVGAYATQVAEHALALLLAGTRGIAKYARRTSWEAEDERVLAGSKVAIVGAGGIGRELMKMLEPHDVEIIAVTRSGRDGTLSVDEMPEVWGTADHFVICAPATSDTEHLVGKRELDQMQPHSWLVNIARGSLIDSDALADALREHRIGGAALDVTDPEPLPDGHPLWELALITPHVANPPSTMHRDLAKRVRENVRRYVNGEELLAPVSPEQGY